MSAHTFVSMSRLIHARSRPSKSEVSVWRNLVGFPQVGSLRCDQMRLHVGQQLLHGMKWVSEVQHVNVYSEMQNLGV